VANSPPRSTSAAPTKPVAHHHSGLIPMVPGPESATAAAGDDSSFHRTVERTRQRFFEIADLVTSNIKSNPLADTLLVSSGLRQHQRVPETTSVVVESSSNQQATAAPSFDGDLFPPHATPERLRGRKKRSISFNGVGLRESYVSPPSSSRPQSSSSSPSPSPSPSAIINSPTMIIRSSPAALAQEAVKELGDAPSSSQHILEAQHALHGSVILKDSDSRRRQGNKLLFEPVSERDIIKTKVRYLAPNGASVFGMCTLTRSRLIFEPRYCWLALVLLLVSLQYSRTSAALVVVLFVFLLVQYRGPGREAQRIAQLSARPRYGCYLSSIGACVLCRCWTR